jgi:hypothetical protein
MALVHNSSIVRSGLVLHLDAANPKSYPGSGTTWTDISGNGNNGTLVNGVGYNSTNGGSMVFDGVNDYCRIVLPSTITVQTFTYDCWITHTGAAGYRTIIDQDNDDWLFCLLDQVLIMYDPNISTSITIPTNTWQNVAVSHVVGEPLYFYINGSLVFTSSNNSTVHTTTSIGIGAGITGPSTADEFWSGRISNVKFYNNRALTAQEVSQNFEAMRGRYGV